MTVMGWVKLVGAGVFILALSVFVSWLTGRIDRAAQADDVEARAKASVVAAQASQHAAEVSAAKYKTTIDKANADRTALEAKLHQREVDNAALTAELERRSKAAIPKVVVAGSCDFGPDARQLFVDLWRQAPANAGNAVSGPGEPAEGDPSDAGGSGRIW